MASFTETVEAHNPALTATGLAIWGWIIRVVVFLSFLLIPVVINSVTPLVNYGGTVSAYATKYKTGLDFEPRTPTSSRWRRRTRCSSANAQKFAPELAVLQKDTTTSARCSPSWPRTRPGKIPPSRARPRP